MDAVATIAVAGLDDPDRLASRGSGHGRLSEGGKLALLRCCRCWAGGQHEAQRHEARGVHLRGSRVAAQVDREAALHDEPAVRAHLVD